MDLSNGSTNYLNCCLFCPPPLPSPLYSSSLSWSCVKHLRSIFKNKKELVLRLHIWLSDTGGRGGEGGALFFKLLSVHHLISAQKGALAAPPRLVFGGQQ